MTFNSSLRNRVRRLEVHAESSLPPNLVAELVAARHRPAEAVEAARLARRPFVCGPTPSHPLERLLWGAYRRLGEHLAEPRSVETRTASASPTDRAVVPPAVRPAGGPTRA